MDASTIHARTVQRMPATIPASKNALDHRWRLPQELVWISNDCVDDLPLAANQVEGDCRYASVSCLTTPKIYRYAVDIW